MKTRRTRVSGQLQRTALALLAGASIATSAYAADFPERPITMIVPYAAGGSTDVLGRILAKTMSSELKQQVVVENVGGAGGTLGTARVAKAKADGYTLLFHNMGHATAPALYRSLPFDPVSSFEPIGSVADVPMILVARKDFPAKTLDEALGFARANPGKVTIGNAGKGSTTHLCSVLLASVTKVDMNAIAYKGTGPALNDLVGGHIDLLCDQPASTTGFISKGAIKPVALATKTRLNTLPEVPTFAESGLKDFELSVWHGLYAPAGTPKPVVDRLAASLRAALKDPALTERFIGMGAQPVANPSPEGLRNLLRSEISKLSQALRAVGVSPE